VALALMRATHILYTKKIASAMSNIVNSYLDVERSDNMNTTTKHNLKVAQVVPYYLPVIGGVEVVCQNISEALVERGHEVHVFTANRGHKGSPRLRMPCHEVINGVNVHRFKSYFNVGHYGFFPGFISPLRKGQFDIIHAHCYRQPQSEISSRIGTWLSVPTILHVHGGFYTRSKLKRLLYSLFDSLARKRKANNFDHFIVLSEADQAQLLELNVDRGRISIIRNAAENQAFESVDATRFRNRHGLGGRKIILYLGILHHYKRPELLIHALPKLIAREPDVFLLFIGPDAGELEKIRELGSKLGVTTHYRWLGPLQGAEKHEAIECSEFLALPSDEDPYPLVLLEAMAHRKPVLTTSVVGQASVINANEAGIVVAPGDLDGIVSGAIRLLTDPVYKTATGRNAGLLAERMFSAKAMIDEIEMLYWTLTGHEATLRACDLACDVHDA
jgi:glycosyltransferase involved in cell wall biosynthesis